MSHDPTTPEGDQPDPVPPAAPPTEPVAPGMVPPPPPSPPVAPPPPPPETQVIGPPPPAAGAGRERAGGELRSSAAATSALRRSASGRVRIGCCDVRPTRCVRPAARGGCLRQVLHRHVALRRVPGLLRGRPLLPRQGRHRGAQARHARRVRDLGPRRHHPGAGRCPEGQGRQAARGVRRVQEDRLDHHGRAVRALRDPRGDQRPQRCGQPRRRRRGRPDRGGTGSRRDRGRGGRSGCRGRRAGGTGGDGPVVGRRDLRHLHARPPRRGPGTTWWPSPQAPRRGSSRRRTTAPRTSRSRCWTRRTGRPASCW